jgi:hypothetical protein
MSVNTGFSLKRKFGPPNLMLACEFRIVAGDLCSSSVNIGDLLDHKQVAATHMSITAHASEEPAGEGCNDLVERTLTSRIAWLTIRSYLSAF